jgi:hypothetical protein
MISQADLRALADAAIRNHLRLDDSGKNPCMYCIHCGNRTLIDSYDRYEPISHAITCVVLVAKDVLDAKVRT